MKIARKKEFLIQESQRVLIHKHWVLKVNTVLIVSLMKYEKSRMMTYKLRSLYSK